MRQRRFGKFYGVRFSDLNLMGDYSRQAVEALAKLAGSGRLYGLSVTPTAGGVSVAAGVAFFEQSDRTVLAGLANDTPISLVGQAAGSYKVVATWADTPGDTIRVDPPPQVLQTGEPNPFYNPNLAGQAYDLDREVSATITLSLQPIAFQPATDQLVLAELSWDGSAATVVSQADYPALKMGDKTLSPVKLADSVAGAGLVRDGAGGLTVNTDGVSLEVAGDTVRVKDGGVTDAKLGTRTVNQGAAPAADTGTLSELLSGIVNRLKALSGKSDWKTDPRIGLEQAAARDLNESIGGSWTFTKPLTLSDGTDNHLTLQKGSNSARLVFDGSYLRLFPYGTYPVAIDKGTNGGDSLMLYRPAHTSELPTYLRFAQSGRYDFTLRGGGTGLAVRNSNDSGFVALSAGDITANGNLSVTGNATLGDSASDTVTAKGDVTVEGKVKASTLETRSGSLGISGGSSGITFDIDTDASGSDAYVWRARNAEVMRLTNTGNLGIGTTSPQAKLDVAGDARVQQRLNIQTDGLPSKVVSALDVRSYMPVAGNAFFGSVVQSSEYWDAATSAWVPWSGGPNFQQLLDGVWNTLGVNKAKFRFTFQVPGPVIGGPLLVTKNYSASHTKAWNLTFECSTDGGNTWTTINSFSNTFNAEGTWWFPLYVSVGAGDRVRVTFESSTFDEAADTLWLGNLWLSAGHYPTRVKVSYHGERYLSNQRVFAVENIPAVPASDGGTDLGLSGLRWRDLNLSRNATVGGSATVSGNLTVEGNATLGDSASDTVTAKGNLTVEGNATLGDSASDTVTAKGNVTVEGDLTLSNSSKTLTAPVLASTVFSNGTAGGGPARYLANNQNLLQNPDGSLSLEGWTVVSGTVGAGYNAAHGWQFNASGAFEMYTEVSVWLANQHWMTLDALTWGSAGAELQYKVEELDNSKNLLATIADWTTVTTSNINFALSPNSSNPNWVNQNASGYVRIRLRAVATSSSARHWRLGLWRGLPHVMTSPYSGGVRWLYDNAAILSHNETVTGAWTFNAGPTVNGNLTLGGALRITHATGPYTRDVLRATDSDATGMKLILESGGPTLITSGEAGSAADANISVSDETLYLLSDQAIKLVTGLQNGWATRKEVVTLTNDGKVGVSNNNPAYELDVSGTAQATVLRSSAVTGTAPIVVASTTRVDNLNADLLDGYHAADFLRKAESATLSGDITVGGAFQASGSASFLGNTTLGDSSSDAHIVRGSLRLSDSSSLTPLYFGTDDSLALHKGAAGVLRLTGSLSLDGGLTAASASLGGLDVDGNATVDGTLSTVGKLTVGGFDLALGTADQVSRGNSGASRALVKEAGAKLVLNYAGDFTGGTEVQGLGLTVRGRLAVEGLAPSAGRNLVGLQNAAYQRAIWTTAPGQSPISHTVDTTDFLKGGGSWKFTGASQWAVLDQLIPIDPSRTYGGRVRVKKVSGTGQFFAGYVAYDKNLNVLAGNGGTFGYFIAGAAIPTVGQWVTYEGTISGSGTGTGQFPVGTAYIKPLVICNHTGSGDTLVGDFEFWEVPAELGTLDLTNATLSWSKDSDSAKIYLGDYGSDQKWLTLEFGDNATGSPDRIRFRFNDGTPTDIMDVTASEVALYKGLSLYNGAGIYLTHTTGQTILQGFDAQGRFLMAPYDDNTWQWGREFGYDPSTNRWYAETCFDLTGTSVSTSDYGWNRVLAIANGSHGAIENTTGKNAIGLHSDSKIYFIDTRPSLTKYAAIVDVQNARLGVGVGVSPAYTLDVRTSTQPIAAYIAKTNTDAGGGSLNGPALYVENVYANHSWGHLAEFRTINGNDPAWVGFSAGYASSTWGVGYAGSANQSFAIVQNRGWRHSSWGTNRLTISPTGNVSFYPDNGGSMTMGGDGTYWYFWSDRSRFYFEKPLYVGGGSSEGTSGSVLLFNGLKMVWGVTGDHAPSTGDAALSFTVPGLTTIYSVMLTTELSANNASTDVVYQLVGFSGNTVNYYRQRTSGNDSVTTRCRWLAIGV